jgi:hypothetical protein
MKSYKNDNTAPTLHGVALVHTTLVGPIRPCNGHAMDAVLRGFANAMAVLGLIVGLGTARADATATAAPTVPVVQVIKFNYANFPAPAFGTSQDCLEVFLYGLDPAVVAVRVTTRYTTAAGTPTVNIQLAPVSPNPAPGGPGIAMGLVWVTDVAGVVVTDVVVEPPVSTGAVDVPQRTAGVTP